MGVESTSPCTRVKHLADLLRNKVNSQQYPGIYEDRRPKCIEDTEKTDGEGIASGQKGPWDQLRHQGDYSLLQDSWKGAGQWLPPMPNKV